MKVTILLVTTLLLATLSASGQSVFRMRMDVMEPGACFSDIDVTWGTNGDTIAFAYNTKLIKFWKVRLSQQQKTQLDELRKQEKGDYNLLTNYWGEAWLIRAVSGTAGVVIFLNNVNDRTNYLLFDYTELEICNK